MQVITPCFLFMFHDSIIIWETCFNLFCFSLAITAVIVTFCKLLLALGGKSALLGYPHCHRFGFGACMEPRQLSGMWAQCALSELVRAVCLCHCLWGWWSCLMLSDRGTSAQDALAVLSITQLIRGTKLVKKSAFFSALFAFRGKKRSISEGGWGGGNAIPSRCCCSVPAWCSPPAGKYSEVLEIPGNTNPRALV